MSTFNIDSGLVNANEDNLFPILPSTIRDSSVRFSWNVVSPQARARFSSLPPSQPRGWTISVHPDGKHYAHKAWAGITIVTEACVMNPGVSDRLNAWLAIIYNVITKEHIQLPETSHLFLEIHQDLCACNYYFVDHFNHTVFWLHTLNITGIESPRSFSNGHLRHPLQNNYWIHVELFPETASKYSALALNQLHAVLLLARAEAAAFEPPAFPYTDEECEDLIEALERDKGNGSTSSTHATITVAMLWATIASHRSLIYFDSKRSPILTFVSKMLLFNLPEDHRARFESFCVDQLIYTPHWRKHVSETAGDLGKEMARSSALLTANIFMLQISPLLALAKLSLVLCILGLMVASLLLLLLKEQQRLVGRNYTTSAVYLVNRFTSYGFQPIAIVHSLPQALFLWSLFLLIIQLYYQWRASPRMPPTYYLLVIFLLVAVLLLAMVACVTYERSLSHTRQRQVYHSTSTYTSTNSSSKVDRASHRRH